MGDFKWGATGFTKKKRSKKNKNKSRKTSPVTTNISVARNASPVVTSNIKTSNTSDNSYNQRNMEIFSKDFTSTNDDMKPGVDELTPVTKFSDSSISLAPSNHGENIHDSETKPSLQINCNKERTRLYFSDSDSEDNIASPILSHIYVNRITDDDQEAGPSTAHDAHSQNIPVDNEIPSEITYIAETDGKKAKGRMSFFKSKSKDNRMEYDKKGKDKSKNKDKDDEREDEKVKDKKEVKLTRKQEKKLKKMEKNPQKEELKLKQAEREDDKQRMEDLNYIRENLWNYLPTPEDDDDEDVGIFQNVDSLDDVIDIIDEFGNAPTRTISTTTMGKKRWSINCQKGHRSDKEVVKLFSIGRGRLRQTCESPPLPVIDNLPRRTVVERPYVPMEIPDRVKVLGAPKKQILDPNRWTELDKYMTNTLCPKAYKPVIQPMYTTGNDNATSAIIDFDELTPERGIWSSYSDYDIESTNYDSLDTPPRIHYAFGDPDNADYANEQLSLFRCTKIYQQNMRSAQNPCDIPKEKRETARAFSKSVNKAEPSAEQAAIMDKLTKKGYVPRIRRIRAEGSYDNNSVDEKKMLRKNENILRYTWKGKLLKLRNYVNQTKHHKEINMQDGCGRSACHFASSWDCPKTLSTLLMVPGIDVNLQDDEGKTPLYKAVEINSINCVKLLIQHGANPRITAQDNRNPFEFALQERGDIAFEIIKYLYLDGKVFKERKEEGILSHLHQACLARKDVTVLNVTKELLQFGAYINATEGTGKTPLILATQMNRPELVELFLQNKADAKHIDLEYKSAMNYAIPGEECYDMIKKAMRRNKTKGRRVRGIEERDRILKYTQKCHWETKQEITSKVNNVTYEVKKPIATYQVRVRPTTPNYK